MDNSVLFELFQIKDLRLKNRIVMAPMHTRFASESGEVTDRLIYYLTERARGGVGLVILENTCIDWEYGRAAGNPVTIHDELNRTGLSNIAFAVHRFGAKIFTQLHHTGRQNLKSNIIGAKAPVAPSAVRSLVGGDQPRALEDNEIWAIIQKYADGARRSKEAGFDGVELHGSHGYLLTQFFSPYTNRRDDRWGGSLENRARFPLEVVRRIRSEVGPEFPISYRLSAVEYVPGGTSLEDSLQLVSMLEEAGVDCFNVTAGIYDSQEWMCATQGMSPGHLIHLAEAVKRATKKPVIGISRLGWDLNYAAKIVKEGKIDLVGIGRSLLADPYLVKKYREGKKSKIRPCIACNDCLGMMFNGWQVHCAVNPMLGNEYLNPVRPSESSKKVVVVGGGPSGMKCAIISAQRGHTVTLIEQSNQLGGQLIAASKPAYKKQEIEALIAYYKAMLNRLEVKVKLNTEFTERLLDNQDVDVVVIAVGAVSQMPEFGGAEHVMTAMDVLLSMAKDVGKNVVVVGGNGVGIDVALFLKEDRDRNVTVIEKLDEIGKDLNETLRKNTMRLAEEKGIEFLTKSEVISATKGEVHVKTLAEDINLACDTVISAIGFISRDTDRLRKSLEKRGIETFLIGSAETPGKLFDATQSGFWVGVEI